MANRAYKRLLLVGDERKGGSKALIQHHATWLTGRGCACEIVIDRESSLADREADAVVVWGGDGSLIGAARRMGQNQRPTLGINRGRLGFLTSFEYEQTQQALDLLGGRRARSAFDLSLESPATRERYGLSRWAQSVLLARRLIEAGVSLVQINWANVEGEPNAGSWDTHERHNDLLQRFLMPWMDRAFSALISDLSERGLLDETLVLGVGEFGHTPKFNANAGRDHWGHCFSVALAGGGVRGGVVHGKSDGHAAWPVAGRVEPRDLHATMFHCLGFPPETELTDTEGRPHPLSRGRVIDEIL